MSKITSVLATDDLPPYVTKNTLEYMCVRFCPQIKQMGLRCLQILLVLVSPKQKQLLVVSDSSETSASI